jgi:hypothetical protein
MSVLLSAAVLDLALFTFLLRPAQAGALFLLSL